MLINYVRYVLQKLPLTESKLLYDTKNYLGYKKNVFHIGMSIVSFVVTTFLAGLAFKELLLSWENAARFVGYLFVIIWTIGMTIMTADKVSKNETLDYISRLQVILDKYESAKGGRANERNSESVGLSNAIIGRTEQEAIS